MTNGIDDTNKYPCMKCFQTGILRSQNNIECPYCNGRGGFTREEFLAINLMSGIAVMEVKGTGADIELHIHLPNEEE